jgi:microcystin degradation protein MlrC
MAKKHPVAQLKKLGKPCISSDNNYINNINIQKLMKKVHQYVVFFACLLIGFTSCKQEKKLPRIGIAGISIECSTFSPATSDEAAFRVKEGEDLLNSYPFLLQDSVLRTKAEWLPTRVSSATPGGIVTREAYESITKKTLDMLRENLPYDGLFLDIHGAMSVQGLEDPEGDFIQRVRNVVGYETVISTCMDLHGNVSHRLAQNTDLITCFRMAPHEDRMISKRRTVANLIERFEKGLGKPAYKAWVYVPILLPGEKTSTRVEPGKSLYAKLPSITAKEGVTDAAIWIAYAWADEPRNHGTVMVTGDDKKAVEESALYLAKSFWDVRNKFEFVAPTADLDVCVQAALKSDKKPYFISDMGDNPTAGGAGDVTWTIHELSKYKEFQKAGGKKLVYASLPGAELVKKAIEAGIGGTVEGEAGAKVDNRYAPPFKLKGTVVGINEKNVNNKAVVIRMGAMDIIVTEKRTGFHYPKNFEDLGIKPLETDIIVVKLGYLTEGLYDIRADWMMALTRGGVDQDLEKLPYKNIHRPMFPLDKDMADPEFKVEFIPLSK